MRVNRLAVVILAALLPVQAMAGFIDNYTAWKKAPVEQRAIYLQGALDAFLQLAIEGEPKNLTARRDGIGSCLNQQEFSLQSAMELIDNHYKDYPVDWHFAPAPVLYYEMLGMCLPQINEEREKLGLPPNRRLPRQLTNDTP